MLLHQLAQLPLGHDGVVDAKAGKLDLTGLAGTSVLLMTQSYRGRWSSYSREQREWVMPSQGVLDGVAKSYMGKMHHLVPWR